MANTDLDMPIDAGQSDADSTHSTDQQVVGDVVIVSGSNSLKNAYNDPSMSISTLLFDPSLTPCESDNSSDVRGKSEDEGRDSHTENPPDALNSTKPTTPSPAPLLDEYNETLDPNFPWPKVESHAQKDWDYQKRYWDKAIGALDKLMDMIGLEPIKAEFVKLNAFIEAANRQELGVAEEKFGAVFIGNQGTGKTTVAELYADFLRIKGAIPQSTVTKITGTRLVSGGMTECVQLLNDLSSGGLFLVEEAHHMVSSSSDSGGALLDFLLSEVEQLTGKVVFVFAGYGKHMETFCAHSPAFPSLIPTTFNFPDYEDHELHRLLVHELESKFRGKLEVEGGYNGLYMRIVARRLGRSRGKYGFGNARDVQNTVSKIRRRQAARLFQSMKVGTHNKDDDRILTQEDLIGPPPSTALDTSAAWEKLQSLIGLKAVKNTVKALIHQLQINYDRELAEQPLVECSQNKLFLGNPGTGKTTVAKLYGQILADIGLLSKGEVVVKKPPEFIGDALGSSERNTLAILNATKGKVLIIDEAYSLGGGGDRPGATHDPFRTAVIDTIVGEVQSTAVEDRCVLLLGYRDRMESMLNESNEALARRFPLATAFQFEDYTPGELREILELRLKEQGFRADDAAKNAACEELERSRNRPGFGNAGEVDILLDKAKVRHHQRMLESGGTAERDLFTPKDFDPDYERGSRSLLDVRELFSDFIGCEAVIEKLEDFQLIVRNMKALSKDQPEGKAAQNPRDVIPFIFLFCGPPGTGKTTTAKRMGELFYDMGFLATKEVLERSATDLIGEYVGHTGPKTKRLFETALGRVLLIDEAYKLAEGPYSKEAMIEMINNLTKDKYRNKFVIILAGYEHEINKLMAVNDGLSSRFPESIKFNSLTVPHCVKLLFNCLEAKGLDIGLLAKSKELKYSLESSFEKLSLLPSWGNARDVQTLAKTIYLNVLKTRVMLPSWIVKEDMVKDTVASMLSERQSRESLTRRSRESKLSERKQPLHEISPHHPLQSMMPRPMMEIKTNIDIKRSIATEKKLEELQKMNSVTELDSDDDKPRGTDQEAVDSTPRDPDIPNDVWDDLQAAKKAAKERERDLDTSRNMLGLIDDEVQSAKAALSSGVGTPEALQRFREKLRVAENKHARQKKRVDEKEEEERKEREIKAQLRGKCPLGYEWIKQEYGYRCAGGSHYITTEQISRGDWEPKQE